MGERPVDPPTLALLVFSRSVDPEVLLASSVVGMPFLTRQFRVLVAAGYTKIVLVGAAPLFQQALSLKSRETFQNHWLFPGNVTVDTCAVSDLPGYVAGDAHSQRQILVQRVDTVYALSAYTRLRHEPRHIDRRDHFDLLALVGGNDAAKTAMSLMDRGDTENRGHTQDVMGRVKHGGDVRGLENTLWDSCRKEQDGYVSRFLNRPVSLALSKRLASTKISPNQITISGVLLGIVAAFFASLGGYGPILLGAVLLQAVSVLDGVDGELARVRLQFSRFGQWLDTLGDDFVNIAFVMALAHGLSASAGAKDWVLPTYLCAVVMVGVAILNYLLLKRTQSGDILSLGWFEPRQNNRRFSRAWFEQWGGRLFRRDLLVALILVCALIDQIHWAVAVVFCSGVLTLCAQVNRMLRQ